MKCVIGVGFLAATLFLGCSDEREPTPPDAGLPAEAAAKDAAPPPRADVSIDVPTGDGYIDLFDVFPLPDGGCLGCIGNRCSSQINACFNNPACAAGLFCTLQMCAGGLLGEGGFNPSSFACVLGCFGGDQNLAFMAISSLTCVTMTCGSACNFLDAGSDVRPIPDGQVAPDASADASSPPDAVPDAQPEDSSADATPDAGPGTDAADQPDGDGAPPGNDAVADDGTSDTGGQVDTGSPSDVTTETDPPSDDGGAD